MATPNADDKTFGQKVADGAAWGLGFALISVPLAGLLKIIWNSATADDKHHSTEIDTSEED